MNHEFDDCGLCNLCGTHDVHRTCVQRRYVSIDIETTGLDPEKCQVIEVGAVIETIGSQVPVAELPSFHCYVVQERYSGEPYALSMHAETFRRIASKTPPHRYEEPGNVGNALASWLMFSGFKASSDGTITVRPAGKNFGAFDLQFLNRLPLCGIKLAHRAFDPGILFFDPLRDDRIPAMGECLKRAGLDSVVKHTALEDAQDIVRLLRHAFTRTLCI